MDHEYYMSQALSLAREAEKDGDVPVGCVIVREGEIIGRGRNRREADGDATAHVEPCPMCAGGIINARVEEVRYGARDEKAGCCGSVLNLFEERFNHHPRIYQGPLAGECEKILLEFFEHLR